MKSNSLKPPNLILQSSCIWSKSCMIYHLSSASELHSHNPISQLTNIKCRQGEYHIFKKKSKQQDLLDQRVEWWWRLHLFTRSNQIEKPSISTHNCTNDTADPTGSTKISTCRHSPTMSKCHITPIHSPKNNKIKIRYHIRSGQYPYYMVYNGWMDLSQMPR